MRSIIRKLLDPFLQKTRMNALMQKSNGEISLEGARFLGELIKSVETDGPLIEVGTHFGFSTQLFCLFKDPARRLITVDNYSWNSLGLSKENQYAVTEHILAEGCEKFHVEQQNIDKDTFYSEYAGPSPSLVFLDAIHEYEETRKDILWAKSVSAEIICGHDYSEEHPGVMQAVDEAGGVRELVDTVWVLKREK